MRCPTLLLCLVVTACRNNPVPEGLAGHWQATSYMSGDSIWPVDVHPVSLDLETDHSYLLHWYGGEEQSGTYEVGPDGMVITPDEPKAASRMRILFFQEDSLMLAGPLGQQNIRMGFRKTLP